MQQPVAFISTELAGVEVAGVRFCQCISRAECCSNLNQGRHPNLVKADSGGSKATTILCVRNFFLLEAAWVDPGRSALQSAEQRC